MSSTPPLQERLERFAPGARWVRSWPLVGGISGRMNAIAYELDGQLRHVVVREQAWGTWAERRESLQRELTTLQALRQLELPAPVAYGIDVGDEQGEPALFREYIPADPDLAPPDVGGAMREMARVLRQIHRVDGNQPALAFLPRRHQLAAEQLAQPPGRPDESLGETRIRAALPAFAKWPHHNALALAHGDFWPGNLLWEGDRIARVVDWEEAAVADPLFDLGIARLDIAFAFGLEAMQSFMAEYQSLADLDYGALPHWDLNAALRPMHHLARWAESYPAPPINRPDVTHATMKAAHAAFVEQALAALD